ncbi:MAG TPA: valine--tRNA ligase, partial [Alphaproteobacteria bacterium]
KAEIDWVVRLVSEVRAVRAAMNVPAAARIPLMVKDAGETTRARLAAHEVAILRLARLARVAPLEGPVPEGVSQSVLDEATLILPLAGIIDVAEEKARLEREIAKAEGEIGRLENKLRNKGFLEKAPEEVVEENRERLAEFAAQRQKLSEALSRIAAS